MAGSRNGSHDCRGRLKAALQNAKYHRPLPKLPDLKISLRVAHVVLGQKASRERPASVLLQADEVAWVGTRRQEPLSDRSRRTASLTGHDQVSNHESDTSSRLHKRKFTGLSADTPDAPQPARRTGRYPRQRSGGMTAWWRCFCPAERSRTCPTAAEASRCTSRWNADQ